MRSSTAYCGPATAVPTAGTFRADPASRLPEPETGARRTRLNGATPPSSSYGPIDIPAAGSCDARWAGEGGQALQGGAPATERQHESSLVVGDGTATTAGSSSSSSSGSSSWVRFAWEPLVAVGRSRDSSMPAAGSGVGVGSAPETSDVTLLQQLSDDPARQGHEKGVKRARASSAGGVGEETAARWAESSRNRRVLPDRAEWDWGAGWPRRQQCWRHEHSTGGFGAGGAAPLSGRARAEPGRANSFSMSSRELAGAAEVAGRPEGGHDHAAPQLAVGSRGYGRRSVGGVSTRSCGGGGNGLGDAKEDGQAEGIGATAVITAPAAYQQQREQEHSQEVGARAKKPRYHRSRVQGTLSVTQMDTLTDGVGSLGVASPEATNSGSDDGKGAPPALSGRRDHLSPRGTLNGSKIGAFRPQRQFRPTLAFEGVGGNGTGAGGGGGGGGGVGARCNNTATRGQTVRSGATAGSPGWHYQPKRRRNGSLSAGGSSFRYRVAAHRVQV